MMFEFVKKISLCLMLTLVMFLSCLLRADMPEECVS